jgi:hypothetical protein
MVYWVVGISWKTCCSETRPSMAGKTVFLYSLNSVVGSGFSVKEHGFGSVGREQFLWIRMQWGFGEGRDKGAGWLRSGP